MKKNISPEHKAKLVENLKKSRSLTLSNEMVSRGMLYVKVDSPALKKNYYIYQVNYKWYEAFYSTNNRLPSNESFGKTAYCCMTLDDAERCIKVLQGKNRH